MMEILYLAWNRREFTELTFELLLRNTDWSLVDGLVVYDDGSTDGTREFLDGALGRCPAEARLVHLGFRSPVTTMSHYLDSAEADLFVKIDNDIALPPDWLPPLLRTMERNPDLELLGFEAGMVAGPPFPERPGWAPARWIGGIGLMRMSAFHSRPPMRVNSKHPCDGFTGWQIRHNPVRGWVQPMTKAISLDRIPEEPWISLSERYVGEGWQRPWPRYLPIAHEWWRWLDPELEAAA